MLVDDHSGFRQTVKMVLKALAAEYVECEDGQEAVAEYEQVRPDIVLMDIAMKGLDGLKATTQIKKRFPAARVLILTQYEDSYLREAAQKAGVCGYVLKEDLSHLQSLICASLESRL